MIKTHNDLHGFDIELFEFCVMTQVQYPMFL